VILKDFAGPKEGAANVSGETDSGAWPLDSPAS